MSTQTTPAGRPAGSAPEPDETSTPPQRHLRWILPAVLLIVWLVVGGAIGGQYQGKLSQVQRNDASSFLPKSAESAQVADLQKKFTTAQTLPAFILLESDTALTPQQLAQFQTFAKSVPGMQIPVKGSSPVAISDYLAPGPTPVIPSQDGKAALALVNFSINDFGATLADGTSPIQRAIEVIRDEAGPLKSDGVRVYVAGPAGIIADLVKAFGGIDGVLLVVALVAVLVILLIVYRSPFIPLFVLLTAGMALGLASLVVYLLAKNDVITLDGQGQGILSILVVGAATDYSLLLVARYREELRRHDNRYDAMRLAWRRTLEPVAASGSTVILSLLCLMLSDLGPTKGLGPVGAIGIAAAVLSAMSFLASAMLLPGPVLSVIGPGVAAGVVALLVSKLGGGSSAVSTSAQASYVLGLLVAAGLGVHVRRLRKARAAAGVPLEAGRWVFWPGVPHIGSQGPETRGLWARVARLVGEHPRRVWVVTAAVLVALAAFLPTLQARGVSTADTFLTPVESVTGGKVLAQHFPAGSGTPTIVIGPADKAPAMMETISATKGVSAVVPTTDAAAGGPATGGGPGAVPKVVNGLVQLEVTLSDPADSPAADSTVRRLRTALDAVSADALVGGQTATNLDVRDISAADRNRIIPVILLVIFVVLALLLRALVAPLILIVANVLSFAATLGASALVFNHVFAFPGSDPSVSLYGFVFLVALGIDYSIFLMTRVREESIRQGTRPGILTGLAVTGGVITSAGVVLASTFASLGVLPILFLAQIAFIVAFGVLLDTLVVRSLLVPSLAFEIGARIWWPSRLAREDAALTTAPPDAEARPTPQDAEAPTG